MCIYDGRHNPGTVNCMDWYLFYLDFSNGFIMGWLDAATMMPMKKDVDGANFNIPSTAQSRQNRSPKTTKFFSLKIKAQIVPTNVAHSAKHTLAS